MDLALVKLQLTTYEAIFDKDKKVQKDIKQVNRNYKDNAYKDISFTIDNGIFDYKDIVTQNLKTEGDEKPKKSPVKKIIVK